MTNRFGSGYVKPRISTAFPTANIAIVLPMPTRAARRPLESACPVPQEKTPRQSELLTGRASILPGNDLMPFIDTSSLDVIERLPGWFGRYFHSASMTFAHYAFTRGASIHEHFHPEEEVYEVIAGELEVTIDGVAQIIRPGSVAIVPANVRHAVKALTDGRAIIVDHPRRPDFENA
jgi:mannose-6-phosphate isomerase-like protein (cupin superfamily)